MNTVCGWANNSVGAKVTYRRFNENTFMSCWDLSTSRQTAPDTVIPTIRRGVIRYQLEFSAPIRKELLMVVFCEHPSAFSVDDKRNVLLSFYTSQT